MNCTCGGEFAAERVPRFGELVRSFGFAFFALALAATAAPFFLHSGQVPTEPVIVGFASAAVLALTGALLIESQPAWVCRMCRRFERRADERSPSKAA